MIDAQSVKQLEKQLIDRRDEILDFRDSLLSSRMTLQERENELEEMAGKEIMLEGVDRLDDRVIEELEKIDLALANMQSGHYGRCEVCHRPIATKRLLAIPWTSVCKRCALNRETVPAAEPDEDEEPETSRSDTQIEEALWDELDQNEALELAGLTIKSNDGTIYLTGSVPTDKAHQQILEIIEEDLGYEDVIDRIGIEEQDERYLSVDQDDEEYEKETAMQGEAPEVDPFTAMDENRSVVPPDEMVAEDER